MDYFGFLVLAWLALILLNVRRHVLGIEPILEKKEIAFWILAIVPGLIYTGDYIANHWPQILIPIPQTNATSSGYVTVLLPRITPPLPLPVLYVLAGFAIFGIIADGVYRIYNAFKQKPLPQLENPASFDAKILEKKGGYQEGDTVRFWAQYTGNLDKGYFLAEINAPSGTILPNGRQKIQAVDPTTYHSPLVGHGRMGRVSGTNTSPREWGFQIPSKYPTGKYQVVFEVWDGEFGMAKRLGWKGDFFVVESGGRLAQQPTEITSREKEDFRNGVATEMHSILKKFIDPLNHGDISHLIWSSKAPQSRVTILGKEDYLVLRSFYDAIDERNNYFAGRHGFSVPTLDPLNRKCVEALSRAYSEATWLKIASDTDSLLLKARKSVGLP